MADSAFLLLTPEDVGRSYPAHAAMHLLGKWFSAKELAQLKKEFPKLAVLPYPFLHEAQRRQAYSYCEETAEALLAQLVPWLNTVHGIQYQPRSWRIQCGFFLVTYVQTLYERYVCLQQARERNPLFQVFISPPHSYQTPNNFLEGVGLLQSDRWNQQLYSQIIAYKCWFKCSEAVPAKTAIKLAINCAPGLGYQVPWRARLKRWFFRVLNRFYPLAPTMYYVGNKPISGRLKLMLRSRFTQLQLLPLGRQLVQSSGINRPLREGMPQEGRDDFAHLVLATLRVNFPKIWLEDFHLLAAQLKSFSLKNRLPTRLVTDTGWYANETFQRWAAECAERGTKLIGVQHGGGYGDRLINTSEIHERKCADYYISWGWQDHPSVVPLASLKLEKSRKDSFFYPLRRKEALKIFYPTTAFSRYQTSFESSHCTSQWEEYLSWQERFIDNLAPEWRKILVLRLYHLDYGRDIFAHFRARYPDLTMVDSRDYRSFVSYLRGTALFIADNMGTTMLEALARDIPTLMFWQVADWPSRAEVSSLYSQLTEVQVFHHSPESAASTLNQLMPEVYQWWHEPRRYQVVKRYQETFARTSPGWVDEWRTTVEQLS